MITYNTTATRETTHDARIGRREEAGTLGIHGVHGAALRRALAAGALAGLVLVGAHPSHQAVQAARPPISVDAGHWHSARPSHRVSRRGPSAGRLQAGHWHGMSPTDASTAAPSALAAQA